MQGEPALGGTGHPEQSSVEEPDGLGGQPGVVCSGRGCDKHEMGQQGDRRGAGGSLTGAFCLPIPPRAPGT